MDEMLRVDRCAYIHGRTDCFLRYRIGYGTLQPYIGCQRAALLHGILRYVGKIIRIRIGGVLAKASRGFEMVLFTEPSEDLCRR